MPEDVGTPIYDALCAQQRKHGRTVPDGTPEALAWASDARGRVYYGGVTDWGPPAATSFELDDGSRYERLDPGEFGAA